MIWQMPWVGSTVVGADVWSLLWLRRLADYMASSHSLCTQRGCQIEFRNGCDQGLLMVGQFLSASIDTHRAHG